MRKMEKMASLMVGDGKTPNKYFVSVHDDHLYYNEKTDCWDSASERDGRESEGKIVGVFQTYEKARSLFESIPLGEVFRGIFVKGKRIEDRLSGEIADEETREFLSFDSWESEMLEYTKAEMARRGETFK